ncbi:hypothetical protein OsI_24885 [Oryza sativa Indica Group]|uniref:Uncharacterized protein n=1 Tax=Oryza sativa subsp. indica TaxID=39946 RepID=A2YI54_ORYSI|nr:hypothetical protein OsI_24885 [Oryza sativa Indica Group]
MDYVSARTIKHLMVQLRAAVLGRYNKRFTPEDIITTQRRMCYIEDDKGYVEQESAHAQPVAVYASKKMVYAAKGSTSRLVRPNQSTFSMLNIYGWKDNQV